MNCVKSACPYTALDDYELVIACQQKIEAAFNELYKRYLGHVHSVLRRQAPDLVQNHDDIAQEVFLRVWKSIETLQNPRAFKKWLNRVITNLFYNELRKRPKDFVTSLDEHFKDAEGEDDSDCLDIADNKAQPDEVLERNETILYINSALSRLPNKFKNAFVLREIYGLHYDEIALRTNIELGTVKSRISRAKCKMQFELQTLNCA